MIVEYRPHGLLLDAEDPTDLVDLVDLDHRYRPTRWFPTPPSGSGYPAPAAAGRSGDIIAACALVFLVVPLFGSAVVVVVARPSLAPLLVVATATAGITLCVAMAGRLFNSGLDATLPPVTAPGPWRYSSRSVPLAGRSGARVRRTDRSGPNR